MEQDKRTFIITRGVRGSIGPQGVPGVNSWDGIPDKPPVIAAGDTQQDARDAIGLGTAATADAGDFDAAGTADSAVATHEAKADPHPQYTTSAEAAAAAPVQSVAGRNGDVTLAAGDIAGLGSAATMSASSFATAAQGGKADSALQPNAGLAAIDSAASTKLAGIQAGATANATDAQLRDRATHTGTQPVASIAGFNAAAASAAPVQSVANKTGAVTLAKSDVGLSNVDNTSDANKPLSTAATAALAEKVTGPASAVSGNVAVFDGASGKVVKDGGMLATTQLFYKKITDNQVFQVTGVNYTNNTLTIPNHGLATGRPVVMTYVAPPVNADDSAKANFHTKLLYFSTWGYVLKIDNDTISIGSNTNGTNTIPLQNQGTADIVNFRLEAVAPYESVTFNPSGFSKIDYTISGCGSLGFYTNFGGLNTIRGYVDNNKTLGYLTDAYLTGAMINGIKRLEILLMPNSIQYVSTRRGYAIKSDGNPSTIEERLNRFIPVNGSQVTSIYSQDGLILANGSVISAIGYL